MKAILIVAALTALTVSVHGRTDTWTIDGRQYTMTILSVDGQHAIMRDVNGNQHRISAERFSNQSIDAINAWINQQPATPRPAPGPYSHLSTAELEEMVRYQSPPPPATPVEYWQQAAEEQRAGIVFLILVPALALSDALRYSFSADYHRKIPIANRSGFQNSLVNGTAPFSSRLAAVIPKFIMGIIAPKYWLIAALLSLGYFAILFM